MNTVNTSTGFSPFQLRMGCSPRLIPPVVPSTGSLSPNPDMDMIAACTIVKCIAVDVQEAQDNLLGAKITLATFANEHLNDEDVFNVGDKVFLSTAHCHHEYIQSKSGCVAKFMPRFNGPFVIMHAHPSKSTYTLDLPNEPNCFPTFHASLLRRFIPNDDTLFPSRKLTQPGPVVTADGQEEWLIDRILDERTCG